AAICCHACSTDSPCHPPRRNRISLPSESLTMSSCAPSDTTCHRIVARPPGLLISIVRSSGSRYRTSRDPAGPAIVALPSALNSIEPPVGVSHLPTTFGGVVGLPGAAEGFSDFASALGCGWREQETTNKTAAATPIRLVVLMFDPPNLAEA